MKIVLLSVVLSVGASVVTTALLARDDDRTPRAAAGAPPGPPAPHLTPAPATGTPPDATLEERLRRVEARIDAQGVAAMPRSTKQALDALLAITQGERQMAIADLFRELVAMGDDVVPEIVALLESGRDQDWGGAFSLSGNMVRGYPRLRTLLIDVLRQIGTPEALRGLLDGLRGSEDVVDYRDLFLLFRTTNDETMVKGMSVMVPAALRGLEGTDSKKAFLLADNLSQWLGKHDVPGKLDLVEDLARLGFEPNRMDHRSFGLLVALSPERAFELTRELREKHGERAVLVATIALAPGQDVPRARIVRYAELLLGSGIKESERVGLYARLPASPCEGIEPATARAADARIMLDFLKLRLAEETGDGAKSVLTDRIGALEAALRQ